MTTSLFNIPDEAVEAAGLAWCGRADLAGWQRRHITKLLEAAAPHMQQVATTQEDLDALPLNSVVLDRDGLPLHKDDSDRVEEWCYGDNAVEVDLPAKVLFRG